MCTIGENNTEIEKLHAEIERQDEEIEKLEKELGRLKVQRMVMRSRCRLDATGFFDNDQFGLLEICKAGENGANEMYNQLLENTTGEAKELFVRHLFYNLKCVPVNQKCDCGNLEKQIEGLQAEVRDLTAENVKLGARNENLKKLLDTSNKELETVKGSQTVSFIGYTQEEIVDIFTEHESQKQQIKELKEKYETADLEREHLKTELDRMKSVKKELETSLMETIGTVQRLSAELAKTGKE